MKALRLAELGRMDVADLPDPEPRSGEVRIRLVATGICGSDLHGYTGENGRRVPGQVMGHESVGTIDAVGPDTGGFEVGQTVTFNPVVIPDEDRADYHGREQMHPQKKVIGVTTEIVSSFAQLICVPEANVVALPDTMPVSYGALIEPLAVAVHAVRRAGVTRDDAVLIVGGGPIGQSAVLAAQMAGASRIVVSEAIPSRRELIESLGATTVDALAPDTVDRIRTALGGLASVAIDAVGIDATIATALESTDLGATICLVGMGSPRLSLDAFRVSTEERILTGSFTYSARDFVDAATWMGTAPEQAANLISEEVPLADGPSAFARMAAGENVPGKILVRLDQEGN